jgi:hypothetical protein
MKSFQESYSYKHTYDALVLDIHNWSVMSADFAGSTFVRQPNPRASLYKQAKDKIDRIRTYIQI